MAGGCYLTEVTAARHMFFMCVFLFWVFFVQVLRMMVGVNISDDQLGSIADRTIQEADTNGDNCISFSEFIKVSWLYTSHFYAHGRTYIHHCALADRQYKRTKSLIIS